MISKLPFGKYFTLNKGLKQFSPLNQAKAVHEYRKSWNITGNLACTEALKTYEQERLSGMKDFSDVKAADGKTLPEKLAEAGNEAAAEVVDKAIKKALELTGKTNKAIATFGEKIKAVNQLILEDPPRFNPSEIAAYIKNLHSQTETKLKDQHTEEKKNLEKLFEPNSDFVKKLAAGMKISPDKQDEVDKIKNDMVAALEKSQQEGLKKLTVMDKEVTKFHEMNAVEEARIAFFARYYENKKTPAMKEAIDKLYRENRARHPGTGSPSSVSASYEPDTGKATFKGLKVQDLDIIQTITGRIINYKKEGEEDVFSLEFPRFGLLYYNSPQSIEYDLTSLADTVRAAGHDKITLELNYTQDEEYALELGRKAYEAALKAGFKATDPNSKSANIVIKVNGKERKISELFSSAPTRLEYANKKAESREKKRTHHRETFLDPSASSSSVAEMKNAVKDIRQRASANPDGLARDDSVDQPQRGLNG